MNQLWVVGRGLGSGDKRWLSEFYSSNTDEALPYSFLFWRMPCDHVVPEAVVAIFLVLLKEEAEES